MAKKDKDSGPSVTAAPNRYYVQHPIIRDTKTIETVKVLGEGPARKRDFPVGRKRVVEVSPGSEASVERWIANKCLVPFDPKEHTDVIYPGAMVPAPKESTSQSSPITVEDDTAEGAGETKRSPGGQASPIPAE